MWSNIWAWLGLARPNEDTVWFRTGLDYCFEFFLPFLAWTHVAWNTTDLDRTWPGPIFGTTQERHLLVFHPKIKRDISDFAFACGSRPGRPNFNHRNPPPVHHHLQNKEQYKQLWKLERQSRPEQGHDQWSIQLDVQIDPIQAEYSQPPFSFLAEQKRNENWKRTGRSGKQTH